MGAVYRCVEPRKQKGRYIYNRDRLHKVGWKPKHKLRYRILQREFINIMKHQEAIDILDSMVDAITNYELDEIWCSRDIYDALGLKEYKGFKIHTSPLLPKKGYAAQGKLYF
jgi:hypothetical protein